MSTEMPMTHPVRSKQISNPENYNGRTAMRNRIRVWGNGSSNQTTGSGSSNHSC